MGHYFFIAATCGLALGFAVPRLLPFVIFGLTLGALPAVLSALSNRSRSPEKPYRQPAASVPSSRARRRSLRPAALALALLLAAVSPFLMFSGEVPLPRLGSGDSFSRLEPPLEAVMPATYHGEATYHDNPERLEMVDRLEIPSAAPARTAYELKGSAPAPDIDLSGQLQARGWRFAERHTDGTAFERHRRVSLSADTFPAETGNSIDLPEILQDRADGSFFEIDLSPESILVLVGPQRTFGSSYPESTRLDHPVSGQEELEIPVSSGEPVEVDVRSPLFRGWLLGGFVDWTLTDAVKYLVGVLLTIVIATASDGLRTGLRRVFRRGESSPAAESG